jgi:hypothetical protein
MNPLDDWPEPQRSAFWDEWDRGHPGVAEPPLNPERAEFHQWLWRQGSYDDDGGPQPAAIEGREA